MKKIFAIAVITALAISTLCGCGKKNELVETTTTAVVEESTTVTEEPTTVEPTEESTEATPSEAETTVNLPSDEYLVDYPLTVGDQKVYVQLPDMFNFYANNAYYDRTYLDRYNNENTIDCFANETDTINDCNNAYIEYAIYDNNGYTLDWYITNKDNGYGIGFDSESFEITDTETFENGFTISKITYNYTTNATNCSDTFYVCEYKIDETNSVVMNISNVSSCIDNEYKYNYSDTANVIIDFYRNCENPIIVQ